MKRKEIIIKLNNIDSYLLEESSFFYDKKFTRGEISSMIKNLIININKDDN